MGLTCKATGRLQGIFRKLENELIKKEKAEMEKKRKKEGGETEKGK